MDYQPLHLYLKNRFADNVVLTLVQIEDLLGHPLPAPAHTEAGWWASVDAGGAPSTQARSWVHANRTATPRLGAGTVSFVRGETD